jgi:hypothetical protein
MAVWDLPAHCFLACKEFGCRQTAFLDKEKFLPDRAQCMVTGWIAKKRIPLDECWPNAKYYASSGAKSAISCFCTSTSLRQAQGMQLSVTRFAFGELASLGSNSIHAPISQIIDNHYFKLSILIG